jgi:hypothetical protein
MAATNIVGKIVIAAAMLMVTSVTFAQRDQGGQWQVRGNSFKIEAAARQVAQSARSLKQALEMMNNGRRGYGRRGDRNHNGRGLYPIINAVRSLALDARQVARDASSAMNTLFSFSQLQRSFTSYKSISRAIQNNPRLSYEVDSLDTAMNTLHGEIKLGQFGGNIRKVQKMASRFAQVIANMASSLSSDLRYRRYQTYSERQALKTTQELSRQASELSRTAQNSGPALTRVKRKLEMVKSTLRQAKRALKQIVTSYTVSDQLEKATIIMRRLKVELNQSAHDGYGGNGGYNNGHFGFN